VLFNEVSTEVTEFVVGVVDVEFELEIHTDDELGLTRDCKLLRIISTTSFCNSEGSMFSVGRSSMTKSSPECFKIFINAKK
jgi:hypothetical protein